MSSYAAVNILDLEEIGESAKDILSDFFCPKNLEVEKFIRRDALGFAKKKLSVTYLVMDEEDGRLVAIFTLTHKAIQLSADCFSKTAKKKIERYAKLDQGTGFYTLSAFLIAQFGKNAKYEKQFTGDELMRITMEVLEKAQRMVGGGIVYLECEDKEKLLEFYTNEQNRFVIFGERISDIEKVKYIRLMRIF